VTTLSLLALATTIAWAVLAIAAQLLKPGQSVRSMGMSGLAIGRHGWIMRLAFVVRGIAALALVGAVCRLTPDAAQSVAGLVLVALWGGGSALLAVYDTDMPGDRPTLHGRAHALIALAAYVAMGVGMVLVSLKLGEAEATADVARWSLPIALVAAAALFAQFAGFGAAARTTARGLGRYAGLLQRIYLALVMLWSVVVAVGV